MIFKVINNERINVYFTKNELEDKRLCPEEPEQLKAIFDMVNENTGFEIRNFPLEVEVIPIIGGDLLISIRKDTEPKAEKTVKFVFESIEDVISVCGLLKDTYRGESSLYLYEKKFFLLLKCEDVSDKTLDIIREFGTAECRINDSVIFEHGKVICEQNCIEMFTKYFVFR